MVQIFPDPASVTRLVGAVLQEQHEEWLYAERRYFSEVSMRKLIHTLNAPTGQTDHHPGQELFLTA